jgi:hypothetical protein
MNNPFPTRGSQDIGRAVGATYCACFRIWPLAACVLTVACSMRLAPAADSAASWALEGQAHLTTYNMDGTKAGTATADLGGCFAGNRYALIVTYTNQISIRTCRDNVTTYTLTLDPRSTNGLVPAHIASDWYPLDAEIFTRSLVLFCDWFEHRREQREHPRSIHDPWLEPRSQVAFEASQASLIRWSEADLAIAFLVDPKIVRTLVKDRARPRFVATSLQRAEREMWVRGYAEAKRQFTNSVWKISSHGEGAYEIRGERFHAPRGRASAAKIFEGVAISLRVRETNNPCLAKPDVSQMALSVFDHRLQDRSRFVDGVVYAQTNEQWRPEGDPRTARLFERQASMAPMRAREWAQSPRQRLTGVFLIAFIALSCWFLVWVRRRSDGR